MNYPTHEVSRTEQMLNLDHARQQLIEAKSVRHAKMVRQQAEAIRAFAQRNGLGLEMQNYAAELKLQAERVGGQFLAHMKLRGGDRNRRSGERRSLCLKDLGVDKNQSARWQMEASVPEPMFREFIQQEHVSGREISSAGLLRVARRLRESDYEDLLVTPENMHLFPVETTSHLLGNQWRGRTARNAEFDVIRELLAETRNHHELLTGLIQSACQRSLLPPDTTDFRAIRRYLGEVDQGLEELAGAVHQLARRHYGEISLHQRVSVFSESVSADDHTSCKS